MTMIFEDDGPRVGALENDFDEVAYVLEGLDYIAECDKTASGVFNPEQVGIDELLSALRKFQEAGEDLNRFKKALFRKQTRQEAGLFCSPEMDIHLRYGGSLGSSFAQLEVDLFHGVIGVCTESGELAEFLADALEGKRPFEVDNVREETGDLLWYITRLLKWARSTFLTEMKRNVAKLRKRHGESGFNKEADMNRNLAAEQELIRKGIG